RRLRLAPQGFVVVGGDGVGDHGVGVAGHPAGAGQGVGGGDEGVGHDGRGRGAGLLGGDGVVQTARRAAASIADGGDHPVAGQQVGHEVGGRRGAGVALAAPDDGGDAVLGPQDLLDEVAEAVYPDLAVVEKADGGAPQGGERRRPVGGGGRAFGGGGV